MGFQLATRASSQRSCQGVTRLTKLILAFLKPRIGRVQQALLYYTILIILTLSPVWVIVVVAWLAYCREYSSISEPFILFKCC